MSGHRAWTAVLDQLERNVELVEQLAGADGGAATPPQVAWEPPPLTGTMPKSLLPRARELHRRQQEARAALGVALAVVRGRQQLARRAAPSTRPPATPAYVDVSA